MKNYFLLAFLALSIISCSNDDDTTPEPEESFYALKVGNSWVYDYLNRENPMADLFNGTNSMAATTVIDSVKIVGTEEIGGNTFYKFRIRTSGNDQNYPMCYSDGEHFQYYRDSLGYLVNQFGKVKFAVEGDTQEFLQREDQNFRYFMQLSEESEMVDTPSGTYDCFHMDFYLRSLGNNERSVGENNIYYQEGIGEVFSTISFASEALHRMERRLVSYDIQ
ncbi:hypothetical protein U8527_18575 [Kordia algicida OT-1]|uniref:Lipoprotein n=1 Tax=Kordia algicida OT-1 TaxID=391587 RepID=A9DJ03_9FLAO|nr:hypothetical protein [Kordia algicida]EDP98000.1 hypothetical protein KAOT1_12322 [Kordia algicida OT-1]